MTELFSALSDNQLALLGCFGAGTGALLLLAISYYGVGRPSAGSPPSANQNAMELEPQRRRRAA